STSPDRVTNTQTKSPGKPGLRFVEVWLSVAGRFGTTHGVGLSEMIVDADLDGVEFRGAGIEGETAEGIGLAIEVREHVLDAAADRVSGMNFGVRGDKAGRGDRQLVVGPGIPAFGVEQGRIHRDTDTAGDAAKGVHLVFHRERDDADKACLAVLDAGAGCIDLDADHELAGLPVVADRTTPEPAAVAA